MRIILAAGLALALSACGGGDNAAETNAATTDNMMLDQNMMDANASMNMMPMDGNAVMDANSHNMMLQDATSNDADTNLANGI